MAFGAGAITSKLTLDIGGFAHGMVEATQIAELFPSVVRSFLASPLLGLIDVAREAAHAVKEAFLGTAESAHQLGIEASRAGVSAEFLGRIAAVGKTADVSLEEIAHGMAFLGRNAADAAAGNATMAKTFADLGIATADAGGRVRPIEDLFEDVANAIQRLPTAGEQARAAMDLLSRGGIGLLPVLKRGAEGVREMAAELAEFKGISTASLTESAEKWHHLESFASAAWSGIKAQLAQPILAYAQEHFEELKETIKEWAEKSRQFVTEEVIPALKTLGSIVAFVAEHWRGLAAAVEVFVGYKLVVGVINAIAAAYAALTAELTAATVAQTAFNTAQRGLQGAGIGAGIGGATTGSLGGTIGGAAGGLIGGVIGQAVIPIPGVGFLIGSAIGGYGGGQLGDAIGRQGGGGGGGGGQTTNNITVQVQGSDSTLQMAEAIRNQVRMQDARDENELRAAIHTDNVNRGLGQ